MGVGMARACDSVLDCASPLSPLALLRRSTSELFEAETDRFILSRLSKMNQAQAFTAAPHSSVP